MAIFSTSAKESLEEGGLAQMFDVSLKGQIRVHSYTQVGG